MLDRPDHEVRSIGTRHGEKLFESLLSREERAVADDIGDYFRVPPDGRDLNYDKFFDQGEERLNHGEEYNSHNKHRLDVEKMTALDRKSVGDEKSVTVRVSNVGARNIKNKKTKK